MEQGKIYYVHNTNGSFFMIGRCILVENGDSDKYHTRGNATYITSRDTFNKEQSWSYKSPNRTYREATLEEEQWFLECERQKKFIPKEKINFQIQYSIY